MLQAPSQNPLNTVTWITLGASSVFATLLQATLKRHAIPCHLLRLLFLDLGARAPKTSQLTRSSPHLKTLNLKFLSQTGIGIPKQFWAITKIVFCGGKKSSFALLDFSGKWSSKSSHGKLLVTFFEGNEWSGTPFTTEPWSSQEGYTMCINYLSTSLDSRVRSEVVASLPQNSSKKMYMGVSKNRGIPKWMVYNGKPY